MRPHRPRPTDHGMHCTCGVFCGRGIESWRAHKADRALLDPLAMFIDTPETVWERIKSAFGALGDAASRLGRGTPERRLWEQKLDIPSQSEGH